MGKKVTRIKIENYKSIRRCDLELRDINILIGPNGGGKSNFISFFEMLNSFVDGNFQTFVKRRGGANNLLYFGRKESKYIYGDIEFQNNRYEFRLLPDDEDNLFFQNEVGYYWNSTKNRWESKLISQNTYESKLPDPKTWPSDWGPWKGIGYYVYNAIKTWKVYHFHDTSRDSPLRRKCLLDDNRFLRPDGSNLPAFLFMLEKRYPDHFKQIESAFRNITPFFDRFTLEPDMTNENYIGLNWRQKESEHLFSAVHLSDGSLRMIALLTLLLQPEELRPTTIIIDKPELGLHPSAIQMIADIIKSVSEKTQIIISTQSPALISYFEPEDIIVTEFIDKETKFQRLERKELEQWLEEYSLGELWEKNIIGGRP